jgi:predicted transcriptional regulator
MMDEVVTLRLPEAQKKQLADLAAKEERPIGQVVRMAIASYLKQKSQAGE